ncbi:nitrogen regulatory IIA protein [Arachidicoccus ginsenosidimutans]|uniref:nitrogen regulatory IIA protein n=1 Tax=Arachidicoccus sp. BS20 TaxID=1850526 RepID=UPI0007F147D1|nr:nitrogen regulatory IIA protein [Arachidicoccus sp. BS20]ANI89801.1 nitrogen regulatory IIA protein [Arachidicoccus sp. BS20]
MKKVREKVDRYIEKLDGRWQALPLRKQHQYTLYFFLGYLILTAAVICKIWYDTQKNGNDMVIEHIENQVLKKNQNPDTTSSTLKNKDYER